MGATGTSPQHAVWLAGGCGTAWRQRTTSARGDLSLLERGGRGGRAARSRTKLSRRFGRGGRDRTGDHLLPKQVRYRCATPRAVGLSHAMNREYVAWDSPILGRKMEMLFF